MTSIVRKLAKTSSADVKDYINSLNTDQLEDVIKLSSDQYYNSSTIIDDTLYDMLVDRLKQIDPTNSVLKQVGAPIWGKDVKLPFWMGSMDKIKFSDEKGLNKYQAKYPGPYVLSDKLDGISCLVYIIQKGRKRTISLFTRGDGEYGKDITHLLADGINVKLDKITSKIPIIAIRGELIMSKVRFNKYRDKTPNARNMVGGIANTKPGKIRGDEAQDVDFVSYEIIHPSMLPSEQFDTLKSWDLNVVHNFSMELLTINSLEQIFQERKKNSPYEIDGVIITDNHVHQPIEIGNPDQSFAYKGPTDTVEALVVAILWGASKDGKLIPRVQIKPVTLSGVTVTFSTGFDGNYIETNNLGPGAIVRITRSGEVIPYILDVVKQAKQPAMPTDENQKWHWDKNHVHILLDDANTNIDVIIKNLTHFVQVIGAEFMSEGIVTRLVEEGYDSIPKLIEISKSDLLEVDGFKDRLAEKIADSLHQALNRCDMLTLMVASNKFGHGFGNRKLKKIMDAYPLIVNQYKEADRDKWYARIMVLENFSDITTTDFLSHIMSFKEFYLEIKKIVPIKPYVGKPKPGNANAAILQPFADQIVVFTGFRNADWEKMIEDQGGKISTSVSGKTTLLVYKDGDEGSAKYTKADDLGIKMLSKTEFADTYHV
jgi:DNA ligase (NAD+)